MLAFLKILTIRISKKKSSIWKYWGPCLDIHYHSKDWGW